MKNIQKIFAAICFIAIAAMTFTGCVDQDFDQPEIKVDKFNGKATKTIAEVREMHELGKFEQITSDDVVMGYVVSSDEQGNFYKSIVIQDSPENPTSGIEVKIDEKGLSAMYPVGQQVFIKLKGLYLGDYRGLVQLGGGTYQKNGYTNLSGIASALISEHIFINDLPVEVTPKEVTLEELNANYLVSTLVKIKNVQFQNPEGLTYAKKPTGKKDFATNRIIEDEKGNILIVRNSGYSKFYDEPLPQGSGSLIAVLGQYGDTKQATIRSTEDVDMNGERFKGNTIEVPETNASIEEIQAMRKDREFVTITEDKVIEGVVISSDEQGNFYKTLVIQETKEGAALRGIEVAVNAKNLYKKYPVGQKVVIKCKDLIVADNYGVAKLGGSTYKDKKDKIKLGGIAENVLASTIIKNGSPIEVTPKVVKITELNKDLLSCLVKLEEVQFTDADKDKTYATEDQYHTTRTITDTEKNTVDLSTSKYAKFINEKLPQGSGSIVSVLNIYKQKFQLNIRSTADVDMNNARFDVGGGGSGDVQSNATIEDIQAMRKDKEFVKIEEDKIIEGVVISSDEQGNFYKTLVIQETKEGAALRGIQIAVDVKNLYQTYPVGQKVFIKCKGLLVADNYGVAKLGGSTYEKEGKKKLGGIEEGVLATTIIKDGTPMEVTPKVVKITELTNDLLSCLIKFEEVQFTDADKDKTYGKKGSYATREITDKDKNIAVMSTSGYAKFINEKLPQGSGSIVSVLNIYKQKFQLNIRSTADVDMTNERFDTGGGGETTSEGINLGDDSVSGASDLFISEYVEGSSNNKYLEIFNGTGKEVDLSKYALKIGGNGKKFDNEKVEFMPLTGKLPNGAVLVIKNKNAKLELPEGKTAVDKPEKATYFNGDDAIGLFKENKLIDVFGVEGEDPGKAWDVNGVKGATKDHTLIRVATVKDPSTTWNGSEWEVKDKNDVSNIGSHKMNK